MFENLCKCLWLHYYAFKALCIQGNIMHSVLYFSEAKLRCVCIIGVRICVQQSSRRQKSVNVYPTTRSTRRLCMRDRMFSCPGEGKV